MFLFVYLIDNCLWGVNNCRRKSSHCLFFIYQRRFYLRPPSHCEVESPSILSGPLPGTEPGLQIETNEFPEVNGKLILMVICLTFDPVSVQSIAWIPWSSAWRDLTDQWPLTSGRLTWLKLISPHWTAQMSRVQRGLLLINRCDYELETGSTELKFITWLTSLSDLWPFLWQRHQNQTLCMQLVHQLDSVSKIRTCSPEYGPLKLFLRF